ALGRRRAVEQQRARPAGALQVAGGELEQVAVVGLDRRPAQLAVLELGDPLRRAALDDLEQPRHQLTMGSGTGQVRSIATSAGAASGSSSATISSMSGAARWIASSTACRSVTVDDGHPLQEPFSRSRTTPASTPSSSTPPPWEARYGRTSSSAPVTRSVSGTGCSPCSRSRWPTSSSEATSAPTAPAAAIRDRPSP